MLASVCSRLYSFPCVSTQRACRLQHLVSQAPTGFPQRCPSSHQASFSGCRRKVRAAAPRLQRCLAVQTAVETQRAETGDFVQVLLAFRLLRNAF